MFSFSDESFRSILKDKNLLIEDDRFLVNLDGINKNLIIGKNGAGKTRLLKSIEEFCIDRKETSDDFILFSLDCPKINIDIPDSIDLNYREKANVDIINGILQRDNPTSGILTTNMETLLYLLQSIPERSSIESENILRRINKDLEHLLGKKFLLGGDNNKELMITRNDSDGEKAILLLKEWNNLSPGERIIVFFFLLLIHYLQRMNDLNDFKTKKVIILIDEPELHLHPEVTINLITKKLFNYFIEKTEEKLNGQLFIASHSVFLIPFFDFEEQIYLNQNHISKKDSNLYRYIYDDLIGLENNKDQKDNNLFDFLASVYSWEYASYIAECFVKPGEVNTADSRDKQFLVLHDNIQKKLEGSESIKILDYGCGKVARIGQCLVEKYKEDGKEDILKEKIQYYAYDRHDCKINEGIVNKQNLPCLAEIIQNDENLMEKKETFDIIFLFNVLHEIDIFLWEELINSLLGDLKDDGFLVFCERSVLTKGEKPFGSSGYLVFSIKEFEKMFISSTIEESKTPDSNSLYISIIVKDNNIRNVTNESIINALAELKKNTKEKIDLHFLEKEELPPRKYAFYCQQYFNADHAITQLQFNKKEEVNKKFPDDLVDWDDAKIMEKIPGLRKLLFLEREKRRKIREKDNGSKKTD